MARPIMCSALSMSASKMRMRSLAASSATIAASSSAVSYDLLAVGPVLSAVLARGHLTAQLGDPLLVRIPADCHHP